MLVAQSFPCVCAQRETKYLPLENKHHNSCPQGTTLALLNVFLLQKPHFVSSRGGTWCFHCREPDIHEPPNSPLSKYAWRTKLFCLTCFLVVTLSAALHSSGLVRAGSALLYTGYWTFLSFVCSLSNVLGATVLFFTLILLGLCGEVRASEACEHSLQCDCECMEWRLWKRVNKSC